MIESIWIFFSLIIYLIEWFQIFLLIRFQNNESVQKSISNHIRYAADKEDKYKYHSELGK